MPAYAREFIHPIPGDRYGMLRFAYMGQGNFLLPYQEPVHLDPHMVKAILERTQAVVPLGGICPPDSDYELILLDARIMADQDPASSFIEGQRYPGFIVMAGEMENPADVITHEFTHELLRQYVTPLEEQDFFALIGQLRGSEVDPAWENRPQERLAEYVSAALFDQPLRPDIPPLEPAILGRVRQWALTEFGQHDPAQIIIDGEEEVPAKKIVLQVGVPVAMVDGEAVRLDVAPIIKDNRMLVPIRFIAETLGCTVDWNGKSSQATITQNPA